jgi:hypothetical protein
MTYFGNLGGSDDGNAWHRVAYWSILFGGVGIAVQGRSTGFTNAELIAGMAVGMISGAILRMAASVLGRLAAKGTMQKVGVYSALAVCLMTTLVWLDYHERRRNDLANKAAEVRAQAERERVKQAEELAKAKATKEVQRERQVSDLVDRLTYVPAKRDSPGARFLKDGTSCSGITKELGDPDQTSKDGEGFELIYQTHGWLDSSTTFRCKGNKLWEINAGSETIMNGFWSGHS